MSFPTRREFLRRMSAAAAAVSAVPLAWGAAARPRRDYHVCLNAQVVLDDAGLLASLRQAGVSTVWLAGFFYGYWPWPVAMLETARGRLERAGFGVRIVNVPLGHPGDSLGSKDGSFPLTPPRHWKTAVAIDGTAYAGTSLHPPATAENVTAIRALAKARFDEVFLDDDFRLARGPGQVGGCFCPEHQERFLRRTGFAPERWPQLLDDIRQRRFTPLLREWVEFSCDELTACFRAQERVGGRLGIMVMYLGAEKAGIRLADYKGRPFRVGELMFDDASFGRLKGKTDELFSALFHRRFVAPDQAYSETTAYPANRLSAAHMSAKLVISTLADVRHTMFMSGITPFPESHWAVLAPEMKRQAQFHRVLAGHRPRGPFKHLWGEPSRFCGDDRPFSLFLAAGIPFEVTDRPAREGWTFLSDADAQAAGNGELASRGTRFLTRQPGIRGVEFCPETLESLYEFKHRMDRRTPFVDNREPAVLGWYPTARAALLWNPEPARKTFLVRHGTHAREVTLEGLESALLEDLAA